MMINSGSTVSLEIDLLGGGNGQELMQTSWDEDLRPQPGIDRETAGSEQTHL